MDGIVHGVAKSWIFTSLAISIQHCLGISLNQGNWARKQIKHIIQNEKEAKLFLFVHGATKSWTQVRTSFHFTDFIPK